MKYIVFLLSISSLLFGEQDYTIEPLGKVQLRYEDRLKEYTPLGKALLKSDKTQYNDYIIGGTFGVRTIFDSYTFETLAYGTTRLHNKDDDPLKNEDIFYDNDGDGFLFLGELNLKKEFDKHSIKLGRQSYNTPLVNLNYRITTNSYEGINYNYHNENFELQSLYFYKVASSTLSNSVPFNHRYGFLGYGLGYDTSEFEDLSTHLINKKLSTKGALHFLTKYKKDNAAITFENLYVDNFLNTTNLIFEYSINNFYLKLGATTQFSVGKDHIENNIEVSERYKNLEAQHYQMQLKYQKNDFTIAYSLSRTPYNKDSIYNGTLYSPFSNKTSWLVGINTNHATIADTTSQKIAILYKGTKLYKIPLVLASGYIQYDIGNNNGLSPNSLDTSEHYYHIKGYFSKHLTTTLQYSYAKNYDPLREKVTATKLILTYQF